MARLSSLSVFKNKEGRYKDGLSTGCLFYFACTTVWGNENSKKKLGRRKNGIEGLGIAQLSEISNVFLIAFWQLLGSIFDLIYLLFVGSI